MFTREDTSSLPVPETKFKGSEGERLGQLVVTPEVVVSTINNMKENNLLSHQEWMRYHLKYGNKL